jgi:hypothetical protein
MKPFLSRLTALLVLPLAACSAGASTEAPLPRFVTQPFYEPVLVDWAVAYRDTLDGPLPFDLDTRTRSEGLDRIEEGDADLLLTSGEPPEAGLPRRSAGWGWRSSSPDNPVATFRSPELRPVQRSL